MTKRLPLLAFGAALLMASAALASTPSSAQDAPPKGGASVTLRVAPAGHAGVITLGDLFEGAPPQAAEVVVARAPAGTEAVLDSADLQRAAHLAGLDWDNAQGLHRVLVAVVSGPRGTAAGEARPRPGHAQQALVYTRNLMAGEVIAAADLQWSDQAVAGADAPRDPYAVIGKAARGPLRAGVPVAGRDLVSPTLIHRNEMVSVDFVADGVTLSLIGKAMGDAAAGDAVEVQNTSSKKLIQAIASAPGHAVIGPAAEPAHPGPSFRTAALP
jgi:flagellar basal body P-ring formation protein FlgA